MDAYVNSVARYLFAQSWQIALLAVIAGLISFALRNRSAHVRYLLWLIVLAKCLVPPMCSVSIAVLPERPAIEHTRHATLPLTPIEGSVATGAGESVTIEKAQDTSQRQFTLPNAVEMTILVWLTGMFLFLLWVGSRAVRYHLWLHRRRTSVPSALAQEIQELFVNFKFRKSPRIWLVEDIAQPFIWGLFRGSVYLPADFAGLDSPQHHRTVLAHELSHIARFDAAVNVLQILAQAIFWFHPFVWWVNKKIRQEREKCCDEMAVVRLSTAPEQYTGAIVEALAAERRSAHSVPSLAIVGSVKDIEERIRTMLKPGKKFYRRPSLVTMTIALLLAFLTVPAALVLTAKAQEKTTAELAATPTKGNKRAATAALFRAMNVGDYRAKIAKDVELAKSAIAQGADLEAKNSNGYTPLHVAVRQKRSEMVRLLLEAGANPNAQDSSGEIPLHFTVRHWGTSTMDLLVSAGSDVNIRDRKGMRPTMIALGLGNIGGFDLLAANGATVPNDLIAAYKGNLTLMQRLVENGKAQETFEQGLTLLHAAAAGGHQAIVQLLLANGSDVRSKTQAGYTALHYAATGNHRKVAELLLDKGADIDAKPGTQTPLHWAIRGHHKEMIEWLVARGASPNADGGGWATPLHWAIWCWDVDTAVLLVSHGGDIHLETQEYPDSPLYDSVWNSSRAMTEALVTKAGDDRAAKWAPLHTTVVLGNIKEIEDLLAEGADVNAKDEDGYTPLSIAALRGHKDVVELLLAKGADINARVDDDERGAGGWTSLHAAARYNRKSVAEVLISNGADINAKTKDGSTALSLAKDRGYTDIVELLKKHGAKE
ncbi:MAG: ankyrin repeat domain-containing protein [Phycisphaerales bacterium]